MANLKGRSGASFFTSKIIASGSGNILRRAVLDGIIAAGFDYGK